MEDFNKEHYEIEKLKTEIELLSRPFWKDAKYLGIFVPVIVTILFGMITFFNERENDKSVQISELEEENNKLEGHIQELQVESINLTQEELKVSQRLLELDRKLLLLSQNEFEIEKSELDKELTVQKNNLKIDLDIARDKMNAEFQIVTDSIRETAGTFRDSMAKEKEYLITQYQLSDQFYSDRIGDLQKTRTKLEAEISDAYEQEVLNRSHILRESICIDLSSLLYQNLIVQITRGNRSKSIEVLKTKLESIEDNFNYLLEESKELEDAFNDFKYLELFIVSLFNRKKIRKAKDGSLKVGNKFLFGGFTFNAKSYSVIDRKLYDICRKISIEEI